MLSAWNIRSISNQQLQQLIIDYIFTGYVWLHYIKLYPHPMVVILPPATERCLLPPSTWQPVSLWPSALPCGCWKLWKASLSESCHMTTVWVETLVPWHQNSCCSWMFTPATDGRVAFDTSPCTSHARMELVWGMMGYYGARDSPCRAFFPPQSSSSSQQRTWGTNTSWSVYLFPKIAW